MTTYGKSALVIIGAGASFDLMSKRDEERTADRNYRPPLVDEVFDPRLSFQPILAKYPGAGALAETIRNLVPQRPLETVLREFADLPGDDHRAKMFREIPLYLQDLFGEISSIYTRGRQPPNYSHLVNQLLPAFERVAFVTTNYDLFLEQVLMVAAIGGPIEGMGWYIHSPGWLLVKLHGSVNWGRQILSHPKTPDGRIDLNMLSELELTLEPTIDVLSTFQVRAIDDYPVYPALVAPVEGKYGFVCPPRHVDALKELLPMCGSLLVIGHSAQDTDMLELLRDHLGRCRALVVVGANQQDAVATRRRLVEKVPQLRAVNILQFPGGFSGFISAKGLEEFCVA